MSIRYGQFCPISKAAEVLGERWTILIIRELLSGTTRYSDFQRGLSQISPSLLTKRLKQLEECGLVVRQSRPGQQRAEYHLTPAGRELRPVILGLGEWGMKWARGQMDDDELDVELLMHDFQQRIDTTRLPGGRTVIKFVFPGLARFEHWWVVIEEGQESELCTHNPGKPVDIELRSDLRTLTEIWAGDTALREARKDGRVRVSGNPVLVRTLPAWLRVGALSHVRPHPDPLRV